MASMPSIPLFFTNTVRTPTAEYCLGIFVFFNKSASLSHVQRWSYAATAPGPG